MKRFIQIWLAILFFGLPSAIFSGTIFNITTTDQTIHVAAGGTAIITYTVQNTSGINMTGMKYFPPAGTTISSTTCGNTLANGASCTIQLTFHAPSTPGTITLAPLKVCGHNGQICSQANAANRVTVIITPGSVTLVSVEVTPTLVNLRTQTTQQYTAIAHFSDGSTQNVTNTATWDSSTPAVATISGTGLASTLTVGTTQITATFQAVLSNAATLNVVDFAYVVGNGTVMRCPIQLDHTFGSCNTTGNGFTSPHAGTIFGNFAYIADTSGSVHLCPINSDGNFGTCSTTGLGFSQPEDVAITNYTPRRAYITDSTGDTVFLCDVNEINGTLSNCTGTGETIITASYISLNTPANPANRKAYVSNNSTSDLTVCSIDQTNGTFFDCTLVAAFSAPFGSAVSADNSFIYVSNFSNTTTACPLNADGSINSGLCVENFPPGALTDIALTTTGSLAYGTSDFFSDVSFCTVTGDTFSNCNPAGSFTSPTGILLLP